MKLKIRYESEYQTIILDEEDTKAMWVSLSLEGEGLSQEETESRIQEAFDEQYNKPEYNIWHRETRHIDPTPKRKKMNGKAGYITGEEGDESFDIFNYLAAYDPTDAYMDKFEYEDVCAKICAAIKSELAELVIAIALDGKTAREIAAENFNQEEMTDGEFEAFITKEANKISKKYNRALKRLEKNF